MSGFVFMGSGSGASVQLPAVTLDELPLLCDSSKATGLKWGVDNLLANPLRIGAPPWEISQFNNWTAIADSQGSFRAFEVNASNTTGYLRQGMNLKSGGTFLLRVTAKIVTGQWFVLGLSDFSAQAFIKSFDLINGVTGSTIASGAAALISSSIASLGSGWYTLTVTGTIATTGNYYFNTYPTAANGSSGTTTGHTADLWCPVAIRTA